jgi:hypothetical protein
MSGGSPFDEHPSEPRPETFSCPKCGHVVPVGTPICGNCGTILQGGSYVPEPIAARGIRPGAVITFALAVAVAAAAFFGRGAIGDAFDSLGDAVEDAGPDVPNLDFPDIDIPELDPNDPLGPRVPGAKNVGAVVREIRAAGIPCTQMDVQAADEYVASGSCQSQGQHVQINIYFRKATMDFAAEFYADFAFASAHRDNWWISGDAALMRRIARALDARFKPPS